MAPLAELALAKNFSVTGSDETDSAKVQRLRSLGAQIAIGHQAANLPDDAQLLVYSSAVPENNCERLTAVQLGIPQLRRGAFPFFICSAL